MTSVAHDTYKMYPLMGGNHLAQAGGMPAPVLPKPFDLPPVQPSPNNVPGRLNSSQYLNDDFQEATTNAVAVFDNAGAANFSFADECLFNGSFDGFMNGSIRDNANGLQKQTNPNYYPEHRHYGAQLNGFNTALNLPAAPHAQYNSSENWLRSLFDNTRVF